jgi:lipopolysaccharide export system permease protein
MPRIIPLVLPLSVLLASIMTFGSLAENYEFAAMKSSGISLQRAMKSLIIFIFALSALAFVFANNVIPYAEYKFINFRKNIAQRKPAMAIVEGQFNEIGNYNIKVEKKLGEDGNSLQGVTIHKRSTQGTGVISVIKAKRGELVSNENSNILKLILFDGYYYEDITPKKYDDRKKIPFAKATFKKDVINLDLSILNPQDQNNEMITNTNTMLNVSELTYTLDSLDTNYKKDIASFADNIYHRAAFADGSVAKRIKKKEKVVPNVLETFEKTDRDKILQIASSNLKSMGYSIESSKMEMESKQKNINNHWLALFDKFVIAFACLLMFFIGAPLGAIIRKGGIGLPIVFAVLIFITFHILNTFGKKIAQENQITPFLGSWMSSIVLTPLAVLLTYRATNDIGIINMELLLKPFQKLVQKLFSNQNE